MSLIRIIANGVELDFVKETLTIKKEDNALITDFKVNYSVFPFLVIDNERTLTALGSRDLTSVHKKRVVPVTVLELGEKYYGELQVLSYMNGFRKCNLKYATELIGIMSKKIGSFMPTVSIINDPTPEPYANEAATIVPGSAAWQFYPNSITPHIFPTVKWQIPSMNWKEKFGQFLKAEDDWYAFLDKINAYDDNGLVMNPYTETDTGRKFDNMNVVSPQVFLLSPLFYALQAKGFTMSGSFPNDKLIQRILMWSAADNMYKIRQPEAEIDLESIPWVDGDYGSNPANDHWKTYEYTTTRSGPHRFVFRATEPPCNTAVVAHSFLAGQKSYSATPVYPLTLGYEHYEPTTETYEGSLEINVDADEIGIKIFIYYYRFKMPSAMPADFAFRIEIGGYNNGYLPHPTIDFSRYVPDWTVAEYINQLKNTFNLDITIDDLRKRMNIDYVEDFVPLEDKVKLLKSLFIESYEQVPYEAFVLKFSNNTDDGLYISRDGVSSYDSQSGDFVVMLENGFKSVPHSGLTAELSDAEESKDGVGLMLYNTTNKPQIASNYLGKKMVIEGAGGIHETFWKKTLRIRVFASRIEVSGPFTETELSKIRKTRKVYFDNQAYLVPALEYTETAQRNYMVKLTAESINT
ncbi:hypothetical protein [Flavobacterium sp.]|uniref:hypothetical protein n=1 Tax=Flavobacterium sp. TaxID=239 RepID=UPI001209773B|nr:hypothetical protein [Flavobacterium sp.]RZJ71064.1 MAG: hypothetical protein EOO49_11465 [Flavobacterium sp.]